MRAIRRFFAGASFPAFALTLLTGYELLLLLVLLVPAPIPALAAFAEDFKVWCLGFDPGSGHSDALFLATAVSEPLGIAAVIALFWWRPLRAASRRALAAPVAAALALLLVAGSALALTAGSAAADTELPFPAERLRTQIPAPSFRLVDQDGAPVSLADLRGRVALVTAVYSRCGVTCPMILAETHRLLDQLSDDDRRLLTVVAITLDPEHDTPARLSDIARAQKVEAPLVRLLGGAPADVNAALDSLGVTRRRDPQTGAI